VQLSLWRLSLILLLITHLQFTFTIRLWSAARFYKKHILTCFHIFSFADRFGRASTNNGVVSNSEVCNLQFVHKAGHMPRHIEFLIQEIHNWTILLQVYKKKLVAQSRTGLQIYEGHDDQLNIPGPMA
jgi:hypothetical protein